ncbi:hypothetical protein BDY19DRAFT_904371 [Irpex rosettiformis]|uniref:Uncharacterized protein n=1 Tax=Irpex rosettiformis TaxID=378272 RepID=A0ACB8UC02_9APHY|nr:hypothetical protein BDY19DRAFT_904371 [Irpex rosettiformis]
MSSTAGKEGSSPTTRATRLSKFVSLIAPVKNVYDPSGPSLIIIFGWFVVIESQFDWLFQAQSTRESFIEPVADLLDELQSTEGNRFRGVFLHVMSNGGAAQFMTLSKVLAKRTRHTTRRFPVAMVLDSTPDSSTLRCLMTGISASIRDPLSKLVAGPLVFLLYSVFRFSYGITTPLLPEVRQRLNSPTIIPFYLNPARHQNGTLIDYPNIPPSADTKKEVQWIPRLYVCSMTDEITEFKSVQTHIEEAKRSGLDVRVEIYENSPHVSHAKVDPERYWKAVRQLWKDACSRTVSAKL